MKGQGQSRELSVTVLGTTSNDVPVLQRVKLGVLSLCPFGGTKSKITEFVPGTDKTLLLRNRNGVRPSLRSTVTGERKGGLSGAAYPSLPLTVTKADFHKTADVKSWKVVTVSIEMPTSDADKAQIEEWAIERLMRSNGWVEKRILEAIDDPKSNPAQVAKEAIGLCGFGGPNTPDVTTYERSGYITIRTSAVGEVISRISMAQVVEYVKRKHSPQLSLF